LGLYINIDSNQIHFFSTSGIYDFFEIFCNALIIASLFFVNSTLQASAKNSFFLEIAKFINGKIKRETTYKSQPKIGSGFFHHLHLHDQLLISIYQTVPMIHIKTFAITIVFTSQFII